MKEFGGRSGRERGRGADGTQRGERKMKKKEVFWAQQAERVLDSRPGWAEMLVGRKKEEGRDRWHLERTMLNRFFGRKMEKMALRYFLLLLPPDT